MTKKEEFIKNWGKHLQGEITEIRERFLIDLYNLTKKEEYHPSRLDYFTSAALTGMLKNGAMTQDGRRTFVPEDVSQCAIHQAKETVKLLKQEEMSNNVPISLEESWKDHEPAPIEYLHDRIAHYFHEYRRENSWNEEGVCYMAIDGVILHDLIAKAKTDTYEKYKKLNLQKPILKSDL